MNRSCALKKKNDRNLISLYSFIHPFSSDEQRNMGFTEDSDIFLFCIQISIGIFFLVLIALAYHCNRRIHAAADRGGVGDRGSNRASDEISSGCVDTTVSKFPEMQFSLAKSDGDGGGCAICLTDFRERESLRLRLLPHCGHVFHVTCIDQWLRRQTTCPICRNPALPTPSPYTNPLAAIALSI